MNAVTEKSIQIVNLDSIQFENNSPAKCGEVFITKGGEVSFKCLICIENWNTIDEFMEHVINGHLKLSSKINDKVTLADINLDMVDFKYITDNDSENLDKSSIKLELLSSDNENDGNDEHYENSDNNNSSIDSLKKNSTKLNNYTCDKCGLSFTDKKYFLNHYGVHKKFGNDKKVKNSEKDWNSNENEMFECDDCPKKFQRKFNLQKHKLSKHTGGSDCNECGKYCKSAYEQKQHSIIHSGNKPFKCLVCEASFNSKGNLKAHLIKHSSERPYLCSSEKCGKSFKTNREKNWHERIHTGEKPFLCSTCGESFAHQHKLKLHKRRAHMSYSSRPHKCLYKGCTRAFLFPRQLKEHLNTHTGCKPHACDQCDSSFAKINALHEHKKIHSGIKRHICSICGKAFTQVAGLATHRKTHNLEPSKSLQVNLKEKYNLEWLHDSVIIVKEENDN